MDSEVPCRDTDSVDNSDMEAKVEPLAFTIEFDDQDNLEKKAKKFERFSQRSSLRKVLSPRLHKATDKRIIETKDEPKEESKHNQDRQKDKVFNREKSNLARTGWSSQKSKMNNVHIRAENGKEILKIQDVTNALENSPKKNDEVASQTGTYDLEEEEDQSQVL